MACFWKNSIFVFQNIFSSIDKILISGGGGGGGVGGVSTRQKSYKVLRFS